MINEWMMKNPGNRTLSDYPDYVKAVVRVRKAAAMGNLQIGRVSTKEFEAIVKGADTIESQAETLFTDCGFYRAAGLPALNRITQELSRVCGVAFEKLTLNQGVIDSTATAAEIVIYNALDNLKNDARYLADALEVKAKEFEGIVKCARIGLQDATPVFVSTEILSYAASIREALQAVASEQSKWCVSHFGSADLGTGFGIDADFGQKATLALCEFENRVFEQPTSTYHALNQSGKFLSTHNAVFQLAFAIWRLTNDLEFLSSGPRGGIRELALPAIAPGSSIMPGKINPTAAELASATSDRVMADHQALLSALHRSWGANGPLTGVPVKIMMEDCDLLARTSCVLVEKVIKGLTANPEKSRKQAENSLALGLILTRVLNQSRAQEIMQKALKENITVKEATLAAKVLPEETVDELFDVTRLASLEGNRELMQKYGLK